MQTSTVIDPDGTLMVDENGLDQRRKAAVRTAWVMAAVAGMIFVSFILSGVLGH